MSDRTADEVSIFADSTAVDVVFLQVLTTLEKLFNDADTDGGGTLNAAELSRLLVGYYKSEKLARSISRVRNEVTHASMQHWSPHMALADAEILL